MSAARLIDADLDGRAAERELAALEPTIRRQARLYQVPGLDHEELAQLCRIAVWEALPSWDGSSSRRSFAALVARRTVLDALNAAQRLKRRRDRYALRVVTGGDGEELRAVELAADPVSLEHRAEVRAELRAIVGALDGLTELERVSLRAVANGEPYASRVRGWSKSTDNAAQRAKAKIRRALADGSAA